MGDLTTARERIANNPNCKTARGLQAAFPYIDYNKVRAHIDTFKKDILAGGTAFRQDTIR